jgi:hypothetical protein
VLQIYANVVARYVDLVRKQTQHPGQVPAQLPKKEKVETTKQEVSNVEESRN